MDATKRKILEVEGVGSITGYCEGEGEELYFSVRMNAEYTYPLEVTPEHTGYDLESEKEWMVDSIDEPLVQMIDVHKQEILPFYIRVTEGKFDVQTPFKDGKVYYEQKDMERLVEVALETNFTHIEEEKDLPTEYNKLCSTENSNTIIHDDGLPF